MYGFRRCEAADPQLSGHRDAEQQSGTDRLQGDTDSDAPQYHMDSALQRGSGCGTGRSGTTDVMEGSCAVHQHEFLWVTEESTAEDIAETINNFLRRKLFRDSGRGSGDGEYKVREPVPETLS